MPQWARTVSTIADWSAAGAICAPSANPPKRTSARTRPGRCAANAAPAAAPQEIPSSDVSPKPSASSTAASVSSSAAGVGSGSRSDSPVPSRSYRITVRCSASAPMNARYSGKPHSSSRWLTHSAGSSSGGPVPTVAYATRDRPAAQKRISCSGTRTS